jgi:hypothetical protein
MSLSGRTLSSTWSRRDSKPRLRPPPHPGWMSSSAAGPCALGDTCSRQASPGDTPRGGRAALFRGCGDPPRIERFGLQRELEFRGRGTGWRGRGATGRGNDGNTPGRTRDCSDGEDSGRHPRLGFDTTYPSRDKHLDSRAREPTYSRFTISRDSCSPTCSRAIGARPRLDRVFVGDSMRPPPERCACKGTLRARLTPERPSWRGDDDLRERRNLYRWLRLHSG